MEIDKRTKPKNAAGGTMDLGARARLSRRSANQPSQALSDALGAHSGTVSPEEAAILADTLLRLRRSKAGPTSRQLDPRAKTCTVEQAAVICGISRGSAYKAAKNDELPIQRIGGRILVLVEPLMRMLDGQPQNRSASPTEVHAPVTGGRE